MAKEIAASQKVPRAKARARPRLWGSKKFRQRVTQVLATVLIAIGGAVILVPVFWMFSTSLKTQNTVVSLPPDFIPRQSQSVEVNGRKLYLYDVDIDGETKVLAAVKLDPEKSEFVDPNDPSQVYYAPASQARKHKMVWAHWENYVETWTFATTPFGTFMKNTTIYALVAVFGEVLTCSLVSYGFARLRAPGKNFLFMLLLGTMMLPWAVTMIPSYVLFTRYIPDFLGNLLDTKIKLADTWWPLMVPKFFGSAYLIFLVRQFYMGIPKDYDDAARIDGCGFFQTWARIILPMSRPVLIAVAPLVIIFFALNRYFVQGVVVSGIKG